jgi:alpha-tubulin suppressor-like RCC1 family protein
LAAAPEVQFSSGAIGSEHLCGLSAMGQAYCAGTNDRGELGDGTNENRDGLVAVHQPAGVAFAKIGASDFTCAIATSGVAYCWGGTEPERWTPVAVAQPEDVVFTDITVGAGHACALALSGQAYCWGYNANGELGDSTTTSRSTPTPVRQPPGVLFSAVTAGLRHTCALERATGQPYCWGDNILGELGDGTNVDRLVPVAVGR